MLRPEVVSETSVFNLMLTRPIAREDIITVTSRGSSGCYMTLYLLLTTGFRIRRLYCVTMETFLMHRWTQMMCTRMSLFGSSAWTWGTKHGKPLSSPLIIQQPRADGWGYRKQTHRAVEHAAGFKYHFVCIMWTSYSADIVGRATLAYTVPLFFFLVLRGHYIMSTLVLGKKGVWFFYSGSTVVTWT
jgi:hypothetical protein